MVAATMAAQCVAAAARTSRLLPPQAGRRVDADSWQLLQMARDKQWTQQGEMFVASQLAQLTAENFQADAKVVEQWGILQALQLLSAGQPLLVPYDAAPNHEPCLQGMSTTEFDGSVLQGQFLDLTLDNGLPTI